MGCRSCLVSGRPAGFRSADLACAHPARACPRPQWSWRSARCLLRELRAAVRLRRITAVRDLRRCCALALLVLGAPWGFVSLPRRRGRSRGSARLPGPAGGPPRSRRPVAFRPAAGTSNVRRAGDRLAIAGDGDRAGQGPGSGGRSDGYAARRRIRRLARASEVTPSAAQALPPAARGNGSAGHVDDLGAPAYIIGMSSGTWFAAYSHAAGHGLSAAADQQLAVAIMWAVPALCFPPVIYCMVITWLRDSEDPEEEFRKAGDGDQIHDRDPGPAEVSTIRTTSIVSPFQGSPPVHGGIGRHSCWQDLGRWLNRVIQPLPAAAPFPPTVRPAITVGTQ